MMTVWQNVASCKSMCSNCATPSREVGLKKCGACEIRSYCGKQCQLEDWKNGHKSMCKNQGQDTVGSSQHTPACPYAHKNPPIVDEKLAEMGQLLIVDSKDYVLTTGLNTCIFVVVQTRGPTLAWHAKQSSSLAMSELRSQFKKVGHSGNSGFGEFVRGFIIPGVDRDADLNLKPTSRQMRELGAFTDPSASKNFILGFLSEFEWASRLVKVAPPNHYKDFVVVDPGHDLPFAFSDVARFDQGCVYDAELDASPFDKKAMEECAQQ